jgi:hypothetical protein
LYIENHRRPEFVLPGNVEVYRGLLEDAYAVYSRVETIVDERESGVGVSAYAPG